ncbi:MAG: 4Fe-4S dicluster domain-containing protein [Acutalibacteraceae bacterium]|nr:4Fe-4S dicluster domain-containing protein [Acutalibacteraceae bacterium]
MRKFDTQVQHLKYKVLREVARSAWKDELVDSITEIPEKIVPGNVPTMRCCVYKERAILSKRIKLAIGGNRANRNVIEVINIACDECPIGGFEITTACRGCVAHHCEDACPRGAISFDSNQNGHINKEKCIECGLCAAACPYNAIVNNTRPCERVCKVNAVSSGANSEANIDNSKCIACGACVYHCPFGAISDKSYILNVIDLIKKSNHNKNYKMYAVIAPSIAGQFNYAKIGQVIAGIKALGFEKVVEAALGADMVAAAESKELKEKGFLISSCCPAFVKYVQNEFESLAQYISHNLSPMATISKYLKEKDETAKVVFIGPCTAKKEEISLDKVKDYVDCAITFEELQALFDSKDLDISSMQEEKLDEASNFGRGFARCGGLADAIKEGLKEQGFDDFELKAVACDGIEECKKVLLRARIGKLDANFIEGMACKGGCIGGAGCLTHSNKNRAEAEKYSQSANTKSIKNSINKLD